MNTTIDKNARDNIEPREFYFVRGKCKKCPSDCDATALEDFGEIFDKFKELRPDHRFIDDEAFREDLKLSLKNCPVFNKIMRKYEGSEDKRGLVSICVCPYLKIEEFAQVSTCLKKFFMKEFKKEIEIIDCPECKNGMRCDEVADIVTTTTESRFKIGVSFCGEHRERVFDIVTELKNRPGYTINDIFYDDWHPHLISTPEHAAIEAKEIYSNKCDFVVVFLSKEYEGKSWTAGIEWSAIQALIYNKYTASPVCLLRVDGVKLVPGNALGLSGLTSYGVDIKEFSASEVVDHILRCKEK
jgi:hypothetical protein